MQKSVKKQREGKQAIMKNYQNELSEENAVERWENEGG